MGHAALARRGDSPKNSSWMTELLEQIAALIAEPECDRERIERTLTDGYAHALNLEGEKWRLEKRIDELAHGLQRGNTEGKAKELSALTKQLDGNAGELVLLRRRLGDLRRHADAVRV
jgi:hypothetical protein